MKKESDLFEEVSRKAAVPVTTVRAVVDALDEVRTGRSLLDHPSRHTDAHAVDDLIVRASRHRLGLEFLLEGYLDSVAAEFGAHAFTVEAARLKIRDQKRDDAG